MNPSAAELLAAVLLVGCLVAAVRRPLGVPEAVVAVPAALLLVLSGAVPWRDARDELDRLAPVVAFLAVILVLAHLVDAYGVFRALGARMARAGSGSRLLLAATVTAAVVTAVLSLDATAVLLTPVVLEATLAAQVDAEPAVVVTGQLANAGSLLLPVSNLTNLLAVAQTGVGFGRFTALMAMPWVVAVAATHAVTRWLNAPKLVRASTTTPPAVGLPLLPVLVLAGVLLGFLGCSLIGVTPAWSASAGCLLLGVPALRRRRTTGRALLGSAAVGFCVFVLGLGVVVRALSDNGLGDVVRQVMPDGASLGALLVAAGLAAVLANLLNNLPACLLLLPVVGGSLPLVLAVLIGVNVGPNLTPVGSLASLLWHRATTARGRPMPWWAFLRVGVVAAPLALVLATVALWVGLRV